MRQIASELNLHSTAWVTLNIQTCFADIFGWNLSDDWGAMQTAWRTLQVEEDLCDEQLLDRMDRLSEKIAQVGSHQDGEMRLQATKAQVRYAPTLEAYFRNLWGIARGALQLKIIDDLECVPIAERKEILKSWWEETNHKSLKIRKVRWFILQQSAQEARQQIDEFRSLIAPELGEIVNSLSAFNFGTGSEFWPYVAAEDQPMKAIEPASVSLGDGNGDSRQIGLVVEPPQPIQRESGSEFVNLLAGVIYGLVADRSRLTWDNVSRRIQVGQSREANEDKTHLLPPDFQKRIEEIPFAGNLYDFLVREDKRLRGKNERPKGEEPSPDATVEPINFILRFQRHLHKAKTITGHGRKRPHKSKISVNGDQKGDHS